jgi:hypothetical protein
MHLLIMSTISTEECRKLPRACTGELGEGELANVEDLVYTLAVATTDSFVGLDYMDQTLLSPPGDVIDCLMRLEQLPGTSARKGKA